MKLLKNGIAVLEHDTHISRWVETEGRLDHDYRTLDLLLPYIPEGGWVVDAGAFIGDHTIYYLNRVRHTGKVLAFEPGKAAFACLQHNCPQAATFNLGLGAYVGTAAHAINANVGASHLGVPAGAADPVVVVPFDMFLPLLPRMDFIKLDVEGYEVHALQGMLATIAKFRPVLLVEINSGALARQGASRVYVEELLRRMNYHWRIFQEDITDPDAPQYDLLCRPA